MKIMDKKDWRGTVLFPELPDEFPDALLSEDWAKKIHGQTLKRLNERGGMSVTELLMNLNKWTMSEFFAKYGYNYKPKQSDADELMKRLTPV